MRKYQKGSMFPYLNNVEIPNDMSFSNIVSSSNLDNEGLNLDKYLGFKSIDMGSSLPNSSLNNSKSSSTTSGLTDTKESSPFDFTKALSSGIQLATGIKNIIESRKTKRQLKAQMKNFTDDFEQRKAELRNNDFYATPYTVGKFQEGGFLDALDVPQKKMMSLFTGQEEKPSDFLKRKGFTNKTVGFAADLILDPLNLIPLSKVKYVKGLDGFIDTSTKAQRIYNKSVKSTKLSDNLDELSNYQQGGEVDNFMSWWENQQNNNNVILETINKSYQAQNNALNAKWKQQRSSGIQNTLMGGVSLGSQILGFEEGGEFESLYSEQFVSPFEKELEETKASEIQQELEWDDLMSNWLLEEPKTSNEVSLNMSDLDYNVEHKHNSLFISPILIELKKLGINPSSVTGGKHNVGSSHSLGRSVDLGLNTSFGGDKRKMEEFLIYYNTVLKPKYPNLKLLDERQKPAGQKVWSGSHYHLELK